MNSTLQPNPFAPVSHSSQTEPAEPSDSEVVNLQLRVTQLTRTITDETARIVVAKVLTDLVFLLDYLSLDETDLAEPTHLTERVSILFAIRKEATSLVYFIEHHAARLRWLNSGLNETLDAISYSIKHEMKRIFEDELRAARFERDERRLHGTLVHAHGVLTNCFEQCMISLVRVFDKSLNGVKLFENWKTRRERALQLMNDLVALADLIKEGTKVPSETIVRQLRAFKDGSMRSLMYKDWQEYEHLSEQLITSLTDDTTKTKAAELLLHRFSCYLETLLAHVKTRAVLAELEAAPLGVLEEVAATWDL
jgi:hypothetical protein